MDFLTKLLQFKPPKSGSPAASSSKSSPAAAQPKDDYVKFAREFIEETVDNVPLVSAAKSAVSGEDGNNSLPDLLQPEETYKKQSDTLSETDTTDYESAIDSEISSANDSFATDGTHSPSADNLPALDISALCKNVANLYLETPQRPIAPHDLSGLDTPRVFDLFQGDFSSQTLDSSYTGALSPESREASETLNTCLTESQLFGTESEDTTSFNQVTESVLFAEATYIDLKSESCIVKQESLDEDRVPLEPNLVTEVTSPVSRTVEAEVTAVEVQILELNSPYKVVQVDKPVKEVELVEATSPGPVSHTVKVEALEQETPDQVVVDESLQEVVASSTDLISSTVEAEVTAVEVKVLELNSHTQVIRIDKPIQEVESVKATSPGPVSRTVEFEAFKQETPDKVVVDEPLQAAVASSSDLISLIVEAEVHSFGEADVLKTETSVNQVDESLVHEVPTVEAEVSVETQVLEQEIPDIVVQVHEPVVQEVPTVEAEVIVVDAQVLEQEILDIGVQVDEPVVQVPTVEAKIIVVDTQVLEQEIPDTVVQVDEPVVKDVPTVQAEVTVVETQLLEQGTPADEPVAQEVAIVEAEVTVVDTQVLEQEILDKVVQVDEPVVQDIPTVQAEVTVVEAQVLEQVTPDKEVRVDEYLQEVEATPPSPVCPTVQQEVTLACDLSLNSLKALCKQQERDLTEDYGVGVKQSLADFLASEAQQISADLHNSSQEHEDVPNKQGGICNSSIDRGHTENIVPQSCNGRKSCDPMSVSRKSDDNVPLDVKWLSDSRANNKDVGAEKERRSPPRDIGAGDAPHHIGDEAPDNSELNHSEAGPEIAQEFSASEEVFADSAGFDFLSTKGSVEPSRRLGLESLYVKFDPLVSAPTNKSTVPPVPLFREDVRPSPPVMTTPPRNPALASIERLINISPSPTKPPAPKPVAVPVVKQEATADSEAMLQELLKLREVLTEQDKKNQASLAEHASLKTRVAELEAQVADATHESEKLSKRASERTQAQQQMSLIMEEYEKTISRLVAEKEHDKQLHAAQMDLVNKEKESALHHLSNIEIAFSDVHKKYERSKTVIDGFRKNEEVLRDTLARYEETVRKQEHKYDMLKSHAMTQLESANQELDNVRRSHQAECAKLKAMLKKSELKASSLEEMMEQKQKENLELASICDDLIAKVTS